ncbi:MAG TPA: cytochrome b/b6 domain-containing protein [Pseudomonadales bacterium]
MNTRTVILWDPLVRLFHWSLVLVVLANLFVNEKGEQWHQWLGYTGGAWVLLRVVWGFVGKGAARWTDFFPTPTRLWQHARALLRGEPYHRMGHSPIGALVMLLMMLCVLGLAVTGFMYLHSERFGYELWLEDLHSLLAASLLTLVCVHIVAAVFESWRLKENLPLSMITGKRRLRDDAQE